MKKIISIFLVVCMIFSFCVTVSAANAKTYGTQNNIRITGNTEYSYGKIATVYVTDKGHSLVEATENPDLLEYIGQSSINKDGTFAHKMKLSDTPENYSICVAIDGEIQKDILCETENKNFVDTMKFDIVSDVKNFADGDELTIKAELNNWYSDVKNGQIYIAFYDDTNKLTGIKVSDIEIGYNQTEYKTTCNAPDGTVYVKGFVFSDGYTAVPMYTNAVYDKHEANRFKDGDVVAVIGDSITHMGWYKDFIYHYYMTRYPEEDIQIYNRGINGDTAAGALRRFDWDIMSLNPNKATVMLGVNDSTYANYNENVKSSYTKNMQKLCNVLDQNNVDVTLIKPSMYDTGNYIGCTAPKNITTMRDTLTEIGMVGEEIAKARKYSYVDYFTPMWEFTDNYRQAEFEKNKTEGQTFEDFSSSMSLLGPDRLHPSSFGSAFMAYQFLTQTNVTPNVAGVEVDAAKKYITFENADISNAVVNSDSVSYTYAPKSEPLAYELRYKKLENEWGINISEKLNKEMIKVTGLTDGTYSIKLDGTEAITATATELAKGINIATLENNPNQKRAQQSFAAYMRSDNSYQANNNEYYERNSCANAATYGEKWLKTDLSAYTEDDLDCELAQNTGASLFPGVLNSFKKYSKYKSDFQTMVNNAKELAKPVSYTVEITKQ